MARRSLFSGLTAVLAVLPALLWLAPALVERQALSLHDQADFFYPLKLHTADRLRAGEIPLWNPLSGGGEPWLGNAQSGVFYPPTAFFLLPSPALAAGLYLLLHFVLAAWGAWRFLREEALSAPACLAGAALFAGSGFAASLSSYWNHFGAFAYLPAIVSLARGGLSTRRATAGFGALVGFQAMAGSPEISGATLVLAAVFAAAARPPLTTGWARPEKGRTAKRFLGGALLGLLLAGWVLVPLGSLALTSDRRAALPAAEREAGAVGWAALPSFVRLGGGSSGSPYLPSVFVGPVGLALAALGFAERQRRRLAWILAGVALAGVLLAAGGPPGQWLRSLPPLDRIRYPAKALALTFFAVPMLAGLGCDAVRFAPRWKPALAAGLAWAASLLLVASLAFGGQGLFAFVPEGEIRRVPESLGPLAHMTGRVLTPPMQSLALFVLQSGKSDVETVRRQRETLLGYTNLLYGIACVRTAAALPTAAAREIESAIDAPGHPVGAAGAAAARALLTPAPPPEMGSRKVGEVYRAPINPFRPRLSVVGAFRLEPDAQKAWLRSARGESDYSRQVQLERAPSGWTPPGADEKPALVARIAEDRPERVVAEVTSTTPGLLVLADLFDPSWKAEIDGRPAEVLRADGYFRAVAFASGTHRVTFRYRPLSVWIGGALSAAALLVLLGLGIGRPEIA